MTNSDWWARAKLPPRPTPIEIRNARTALHAAQGRARDHAGEARRADDPRS